MNFSLQVAAAAGTNVEVTIAADTVLATSSSVLSTVLPEYKVRDLPALTGNVFNIVQNLPWWVIFSFVQDFKTMSRPSASISRLLSIGTPRPANSCGW